VSWEIKQGDCRQVMATMAAESIDAIVCDPPYGLSFMGKGWDHGVPGVEFWIEALRVAKPGAHLLAFGGTRTYHRLACAIEDAGWEIRDCVMWVYGSGFPKSHDVGKAIDKQLGAKRDRVRTPYKLGLGSANTVGGDTRGEGRPWIEKAKALGYHEHDGIEPVTAAAAAAAGWGTALKPAWEPIIVARKPLAGTVAENVLAYGTGGINVDGCRVGTDVMTKTKSTGKVKSENRSMSGANYSREDAGSVIGRWPANLVHNGSDEVVQLFPDAVGLVGATREGGDKSIFNGGGHQQVNKQRIVGGVKDFGSAARFFYCAKASKADRDDGVAGVAGIAGGLTGRNNGSLGSVTMRKNHHPTVKPTSLMRYLCRLVTPSGGLVLDPFCGSGSTGKAAVIEGFRFVGIEREPEYAEIAAARIKHADKNKESHRSGGKCGRRVSGGSRYASSVIPAAGDISNAITESGSGCRFRGGQSSEKLHAEAPLRQMELAYA